MSTPHRAGFVHIIGRPNVGKSTLTNGLVKYPLSIATHKPQTTRHAILGIDQAADYQVVYVDTPGYLTPTYALQQAMMHAVNRALIDGDLLLWIMDIQNVEQDDPLIQKHLLGTTIPCVVVLNKIDRIPPAEVPAYVKAWRAKLPPTKIALLPMSALNPQDVARLSRKIRDGLPIHPPYYDKETITDKPIRFFVAEILRRAIFLHYKQEIPYSTEVVVEEFVEKEHSIVIKTVLYVERASQKNILIGKRGMALKQVGTHARKKLESFLDKRVFLTQHVKVLPNWRKHKNTLVRLGYT